MKIVILDGYTLNPGDISWKDFERQGKLTVYDRTEPEDVISRIGDADIIYTNKTPITREVLEACPNIKYIGVLATGYNVVDTIAAAEKNIPVTNIPTYGTTAVAQYAMAMLLEICHHIGAHSASVKAGDWADSKDFCYWNYPLIELAGKTIGVIGFGKIGQATAQIASAFGLKVLAYDMHPMAVEGLNVTFTSLDELLAASDVVSLHCPLLPSTEKIINAASIKKMKDGAIIINTSRGPLIEEQALADALTSQKLAAAAVDVVSAEPIKADNPLLSAPNCIITPHIAWAPKESRQRLMSIAAENLKAFAAKSPVNVVNLK